jgi:O-antigen/teichoic acid export membrane protein
LTYQLVLVNMLTNYISNFHRIVLPSVFHDLFLKFVVPALILLFYFGYIDLSWVIRIFLLSYVVIIIFLLLYLRHLGELHFKKPDAKIWEYGKAMADFAGFSMLGSLGSVLALQLDTFMMGSLDNMYNTGVYSLAITISTAIGIPHRAISNISAPLIAASWQKNDTAHIQQLYRQTSLLLLIAGSFFLAELAVNFPDLTMLSSKKEVLLDAYYALLILGVGRIVDMGTSINGYIIQYSSKYRVNVYFIVFLGLINIVMNLWLIPRYGMEGAALATTISMISFNALRTIYVKVRFGMYPFSWNTFLVLLLACTAAFIGWWLPGTSSALLNMIYKGAIVALFFLGPIYWWKLSPELNRMLEDNWKRFFNGGQGTGNGKR